MLGVTLEEFKEMLTKKYPRKSISDLSFEEKEKTLTDYLEDRLRILRAKELGLDKDPKVVKAVEQRSKRILASKYFNNRQTGNSRNDYCL